jgi:hypothetical protein
MSTEETPELTDAEWRATIEAELARLRAADPREGAMKRAMAGPLISGPARAAEERQRAEIRRREEAVEAAIADAGLERRVRQPEIAKHERKLAELDTQIAEAQATADEAVSVLNGLCAERFHLASNPPWVAPSPFPPNEPIATSVVHPRRKMLAAPSRGSRSRVGA